MPVTRTSFPGGAVVAMVNRCRASRFVCAPRSCADLSTAGRHVDVKHGRDREHSQQKERRMNRRQQRHRHAQPQDPSERGKHRHVHVVKHEHLIAQHGQPVEILRPFLMRDRRDRGLQLGHVGLERDGHFVAKAALHARTHRSQKPRRSGGHAKADGRALHHVGAVLKNAFAEEHEPQRQKRIGQRSELRQARKP